MSIHGRSSEIGPSTPSLQPAHCLGTPCTKSRFTFSVKAKTSPFCWGKLNCSFVSRCSKTKLRSSPKEAPMVMSTPPKYWSEWKEVKSSAER